MKPVIPLFALVWCAGWVCGAPPTFEEARKAVIAARKGLTSCAVELEQFSTPSGGSATPAKRTWRIWWDEKHQRTDYTPQSPATGSRGVYCVNCEKDGWGLKYTEEKNLLATLKPIAEFREEGGYHYIRDPKAVGHSFGGLFNTEKGIEAIFPQKSPPGARVDVVAGADGELWKLHLPYEDPNTSLTITADPNRGFEVTAMDFAGKGFKSSVRTVLKRWAGVWYPERLIFDLWTDGKRTDLEEVVVKSAVFNQPIPVETFTLAGIKMLPNHPIRVDNNPTVEYVRDGKVCPKESDAQIKEPLPPPGAMPVRVPEPGEWRLNPWLFVAAGLLILGAVALLVVKLRNQRPAP
jgi:hypothetical protein